MSKVLASPHPRGRLSLRGGLVGLLLVPFLAIGLVIGTPVTAAAAERFSGAQTISDVEVYDSVLPGDTLTCSFVTQYRVGDANPDTYVQYVNAKVACSDGAAIMSEGVKFSFTYTGQTGGGDACYVDGFTNLDASLKGTASGFAGVNLAKASLCEVTEICVSASGEVERTGLPNSDVGFSDCYASTMGPPKTPGGTPTSSACPYGTPLEVKLRTAATGLPYSHDLFWEIQWTATSSTHPGMFAYLVVDKDLNGDGFKPDVIDSKSYAPTSSMTLSDWSRWSDNTWNNSTQGPAPVSSFQTVNGRILGVQLFINSNNLPSPAVATGENTHFGSRSMASTRLGMSRPAACEFWFGEKINDRVDTTEDEPFGDLGEADPIEEENEGPAAPPAVEQPGCTFDVTDPGTWLEAGMCGAVGVLMEILSALKSLVSAIGSLASAIFGPIVDALEWLAQQLGAALQAIEDAIAAVWDGFTGLMSSLFVPDEGFLDNKVAQVQGDLDNTSPGKWVSAVGDFVPGSVSGCEGLPVVVDLGPVELDERLGAACSGFMADAAAIVKVCLSAVLVLFGAMSCLRAVGSGFGWSPGVNPGAAT